MPTKTFFTPSPGDAFVVLSKTASGKLFRKHILSKGPLIHPITGQTIDIDDAFLDRLVNNFSTNVVSTVQIPLAGPKNEHTEDPDRNIGEIIGLERDGDKLYATLDVRDQDRSEKIGTTLLGASAMLHQDYTDTRTGKKVGPTLLHVAVTNRPYIVDLDPFETIAATATEGSSPLFAFGSADNSGGDEPMVLVPLTAQPDPNIPGDDAMPTKQELIEALLTHGVDVVALEAQVGTITKLSAAMVDSGLISLSAGQSSASAEALVKAVVDVATENVALSAAVDTYKNEATSREVDDLISQGRILPVQRDPMISLANTNREMFDALVPEKAIIALSKERGTEPPSDAHELDVDAEIARLTSTLDPVLQGKK